MRRQGRLQTIGLSRALRMLMVSPTSIALRGLRERVMKTFLRLRVTTVRQGYGGWLM